MTKKSDLINQAADRILEEMRTARKEFTPLINYYRAGDRVIWESRDAGATWVQHHVH